MSEPGAASSTVDRLLQPLPDAAAPCGVDLEYDNDFLALQQAAAGRPETQFDAGAPADWRAVREQAETLFERTRDLRIAVLWLRAVVRLEGFAALPQGLRLVHGLLDVFWDTLHPLPDDGDCYARGNALRVLREQDGLLGDLRQAQLFNVRGVGELRIRTVEVALNLLLPNDAETPVARDRLQQMFADAALQQPTLRGSMVQALGHARDLITLINERFDGQEAPDLKPLVALLNALNTLFAAGPSLAADTVNVAGDPAAGHPPGLNAAHPDGAVHSRDDAMRAIDRVCEFLERTEPTSPAPLLLRRAQRMINRNFLQLLKELAPEALADVARVMGVDPDTVQLENAT